MDSNIVVHSKIHNKKPIKNKFKVAPVCFITWIALGYLSVAQAAVVVDINQNHLPMVQANPNGSVTVKINSASPGGVSHNKFTQFDVDSPGLVLNNSADAVNTTLAGNIAGNKNMSKGAASLIINEVTSNRTSQLNGLIEVAGNKADVIVANPAGVACDGCGFINTGRSTLTTGKVIMNKNELSGISVTGGNITFSGKGMVDKSDYTALLARTININAAIRANNIQAMAGINNKVIVEDDQLVNIGDAASPSSAVFGLDTARLGGMYADKITLITNQSGVGVRNAGLIFADTALNINIKGELNNERTLQSLGKIDDIQLVATKINNSNGTINAFSGINLFSTGNIDNVNGLINSHGSLNINSAQVDNSSGRIVGDDVNIVADNLTNTYSAKYTGKVLSNPVITSEDYSAGIFSNSDISINSRSTLNARYGKFYSENGSIYLSSNSNVILDDTVLSANDINVSARQVGITTPGLTNSQISAKKDVNFNLDVVGKFEAGNVIFAGNDINIKSRNGTKSGIFLNMGAISAGNNFNFDQSVKWDNYGIIAAVKQININTTELTNHKNLSGNQIVNIHASKSITNNREGNILSGGVTALSSPSVSNMGGNIFSPFGIEITANKFTNTGTIIGPLSGNEYP